MPRREDILYEQEYGDIPNDQVERIAYILGKRANDEKFNKAIALEAKKVKRIKKETIEFTMWKVVKPSRRPRANTRSGYVRMYVPGAAEAGDWFHEFAEENNLPFIDTPCELEMTVYEKTPSSFNIKNKVLAELGVIRPWRRTGDFDNYAKGVADAIQHGMLSDDCLVYYSIQDLRYSIKPHCVVKITYYSKHPEEIIFGKRR